MPYLEMCFPQVLRHASLVESVLLCRSDAAVGWETRCISEGAASHWRKVWFTERLTGQSQHLLDQHYHGDVRARARLTWASLFQDSCFNAHKFFGALAMLPLPRLPTSPLTGAWGINGAGLGPESGPLWRPWGLWTVRVSTQLRLPGCRM